MKISVAASALMFLMPLSGILAAESECSRALGGIERSLTLAQLPTSNQVADVVDSCPPGTAGIVKSQIAELRITVLTSHVKRVDADRIESYDELLKSLGKAQATKQSSANQAFGVVLQTLRPVLTVHLEKNLRH